ncbi:MAG: DUF2330 domain-containing protein, partial [Kofleriaceae bacterium]
MNKLASLVGAAALATIAQVNTADAFCGFYVSGSEKPMFADATQVVLMREGTRTVLSMQNDYAGPLDDFAMVVPVPVVLRESEVKTLNKDVFRRIDQLGAPRLVEYWEQDPCPKPTRYDRYPRPAMKSASRGNGAAMDAVEMKRDTVKIEAQFDVGEYKILILSATEAAGLERWLNQNGYKIPKDAEPLLRPYVEAGSKFFVAKVDPKKVKMDGNRAALSPLRFHYDSEEFSLPIRLGMANSQGKQDLIVNIISSDKRYEVANYKNAFIPTNFDVKNSVRERFGEFYAALFDKTIEANPGAVITEYAWKASRNMGKCDPCPPEPPVDADMLTLGGDLIGGEIAQGTYTLTRLHARYGRNDMKDDLRFREAKPVTGGREVWSKTGLEYGAAPATQNNFQARYAIRHWWTGPMTCKNPRRGVWGGPPDGGYRQPIAASKLAYVPRGKMQVASVIGRDLWEIGLKKTKAPKKKPAPAPAPGGASKTMGFGAGALAGLLFIALRG